MRRRLLIATGVLGLIVALAAFWVTTSTDSSQLTRAVLWGDSSYGDKDRFPASPIRAASSPVVFVEGDQTIVPGFEFDSRSLVDIAEATDSTAFVVLHEDQLLFEDYFNGSERESMQTSFSVAKSFIATLVGIAIDEGHIEGLGDSVATHVPELLERDPAFADITVHDLITMSSGLSFDDGWSPWADPANTYYGTGLREGVLSIPTVDGPPGEVFHYNDWNVILLGLILERSTGMSVSSYMETRLWQPMGAEFDASWSLDSEEHAFEKMFVGVNGRAIDFAKLGWVYLNEGRQGETPVVPTDFVAEATREDAVSDPAAEYQYLWWIDEGNEAYFANGDHGQFIYVDPVADIVIVRHGRNGDFDWISLFASLVGWLEPQLDD